MSSYIMTVAHNYKIYAYLYDSTKIMNVKHIHKIMI